MSIDHVWSAILSFISAVIAMALKDRKDEIKQLGDSINDLKIDTAKNYVLKSDLNVAIDRVLYRLELLDAKLDRIIEGHIKKDM